MMKLTLSRQLRPLTRYVSSKIHARHDATVNPAVSEHIALLIVLLQAMSPVITFMLDGSDPFWSVARCNGLDLDHIINVKDSDVESGRKQGRKFWLSKEAEAIYWPVHISRMLESGVPPKGTHNASDYLALSFRINTVVPIALQLLMILNKVSRCSKAVRSNTTITALKLMLGAFLRDFNSATSDEDIDPDNMVPRFHQSFHFAGEITEMSTRAQDTFDKVIHDIRDAYGNFAANTIGVAATLAGTAYKKHMQTLKLQNSDVKMSMDGDCGYLLLSQVSELETITYLLHLIGVSIDEEQMYDNVLDDMETDTIKFHSLASQPPVPKPE